MNFIKLEVLVLISKYNKVTTVAEKLGIKQPTVTFHMKSLEKLLGITLFEVHGGYTVLTEPGEVLLHYANKILKLRDEAERATSEFSLLKRGSFKLGASYVPSTYLIPEVLKAMKKDYPRLEISVTSSPSSSIIQMVLDHELDAGIICSMEVHNPGIIYKKIYQDELGLVFSPNNPLVGCEVLEKQDLINKTFVHHSKVSSTIRLVEKWLEKNKVYFASIIQLDSLESIKHILMSTDWISIISKKAVEEEIKRGKLIYRELPEEPIERDIYVVYNKDRWLSPVMKKFFEAF